MANSKRDHLDKDAAAAQQAGLSYGQYKAEHPHTTYPETAEEEAPQERRCGICGQRFMPTTKNAKYCSSACKDVARNRRKSLYGRQHYEKNKKEKPREEGTCSICGKPFLKIKITAKYCSPSCQEKGQKQRQREHDARRRARRKEEKENV